MFTTDTLQSILTSALFAFTILFVSRAFRVDKERRDRLRFLRTANKEIHDALMAAERVLQNGATPPTIRRVVVTLLKGIETPIVGRDLLDVLRSESTRESSGGLESSNATFSDLHKLPLFLQEDIEKAVFGLGLLGMPLKYSEAAEEEVTQTISHHAYTPSKTFRILSAATLHSAPHRTYPSTGHVTA